MAFEGLSGKLNQVFKKLKSHGKLPAAIRRLRDGLMIEGFARSALVIEVIIASMRTNCRSSMSASFSLLPTPGSIPMMDLSEPIFWI
jgi:hypothetical protein